MMTFVIWCVSIVVAGALWFGISSAITCVAQYALLGVFGFHAPFWPLFALLFVLSLLFTKVTRTSK